MKTLRRLIVARQRVRDESVASGGAGALAPNDRRLRQYVKDTRGALRLLGHALYDFAIESPIKEELKSNGLFLEIATDDSLSHLPWELMNDIPVDPTAKKGSRDDTQGDGGYYCLKHFVGRFVDTAHTTSPALIDFPWRLAKREDLVVVLIVVRNAGKGYAPLEGAREELDAIVNALKPLRLQDDALKVLYDKQATRLNVTNVLGGEKRKHIIHFCGHGEFNPNDPSKSRLRLYDGESLGTNEIVRYFGHAKPILCFINACNSAKHGFVSPPSPESLLDKDRFNLYGLGKAFLDTGTYLLGANWEIEDRAAKTFARSFYDSLLVKGLALGEAVRSARVACKDLNLSDFAWASYVLYGDPRVQFHTGKITSVVRV
jgi:CHAT domain-containing protein